MAARVVVVYFSRLGAPLRAHEKAILDASAQRIAELTGCATFVLVRSECSHKVHCA